MRVLISAVGTRGDVQPAIALALEARALGHAVRLCVPPNFVAWAAGLGFEARPIGIEMRAPRAGAPPVAIPDLILDQFESVAAAADGCDFIVGAGAHQYAARSIAELRGIPCVVAVYAPTALPPDVDESRGAWNQRSLERVNANRARLGLAAIDDVIAHILGDAPWLAADATLGPAPAGARSRQTGAWLLSDDTPLAVELQRFLDAGDPPIYAGFGSMPGPPGTSRTVIDAARAAGRRVILSAGGPSSVSSTTARTASSSTTSTTGRCFRASRRSCTTAAPAPPPPRRAPARPRSWCRCSATSPTGAAASARWGSARRPRSLPPGSPPRCARRSTPRWPPAPARWRPR